MECFELRQRNLYTVDGEGGHCKVFFFFFFESGECDVFKIVFRGRWFCMSLVA